MQLVWLLICRVTSSDQRLEDGGLHKKCATDILELQLSHRYSKQFHTTSIAIYEDIETSYLERSENPVYQAPSYPERASYQSDTIGAPMGGVLSRAWE